MHQEVGKCQHTRFHPFYILCLDTDTCTALMKHEDVGRRRKRKRLSKKNKNKKIKENVIQTE